MEPRIQYAKTEDGVNIAYWTIGEGEAIVVLPDIPISNIQLEWQSATTRAWYERIAESHRVVRYDGRGTGLSDRNVNDFSIQAQTADLEAVAERAGLATLTLLAQWHGSCVALAYCGRHAERVARLILWCGYARAADLHWTRAMGGLLRKEWEVYTETLASTLVGWGEPARRYARFIRESVEQEQLVALWEEIRQFDVSHVLAELAVPTLLLHRREVPLVSVDVARRLASSIPNSELVVVEGRSPQIWRETDAATQAIARFIREQPAPALPATPSGMTAILFADVVDSTGLTERLGDVGFREKARELDGSLRSLIGDAGGTPIEGKLLGDGVLATFASARQAIEAALACGRAGDDAGLPLHLGLHAGDVIREEGNVFGGAVNVAARVAAESAAGEVLVSQTVRDLARTSAGVSFEDHGERELKGVGEPVRVWGVRTQEHRRGN